MIYKNEQEEFWAGSFGVDYIDRNNSDALLVSKIAFWSRMLKAAHGVKTARELGCNIGLNLLALNRLFNDIELSGYEINPEAAEQAREREIANIVTGSILEPIKENPVDLTFTVGVLIHINPNDLQRAYENLVNGSSKYVLVAEYYNPSPIMVPYHGEDDRLFKRDFAGDLIDDFGLKLVDYGFVYRRDNWAPQDDVSWFLLEK